MTVLPKFSHVMEITVPETDRCYTKSCRDWLQYHSEATFLDLHLSISNVIVSTKIYDKRDNCQFPIFRW